MDKQRLEQIISTSKSLVFFGGAGVSTESGIPDFRSKDGLYSMKYEYPPEEILSHEFFFSHTDVFYKFFYEKLCVPAKPNAAHLRLASLEREGILSAVVTQNIDGLHQDAGSVNVLELHGTAKKAHCLSCGAEYDMDYLIAHKPIPFCPCGGVIKPDVVLYGEQLNEDTVSRAILAIRQADALIIGGTSLTVYPAAGFVSLYRGDPDRLVLINKDRIEGIDNQINLPIGEVLGGTEN